MYNKQEILNFSPDKRISNYVFSLKAIIGRGSYGIVYLGRHETSKQLVAIKVIDRKQADFDIYNQEVAIMKQLNHPNIVGFIDFVISTNNIYIITEYCNGPDLKQYLKENTINEEIAIKIIKGIIKGLQCIIKKNFIHRDLKPANILFNNTISKIADFGFSRKVNPIMASMVGTPMYMAPQLLLKQSYTSKCDIWSLGVIYYEMLFGVTPWTATDIMDLIYKLQHCELQIPKKPKISPESQSFIQGCLEKQEKNRFDWDEIFNHPLIKPRLNLQINSCLNEETNSQLSFIKTNRIYYFNRTQRDRSASNKQIEPLKSNESTDSQLCIKHQNNAFIDVAKLLKHKEQLKMKRTQSKFEIQKNPPSQKAISQHNVSYISSAKKYSNATLNPEKKFFKKKNGITNLVQIITNLSDEAQKKGYSDLVSLFMSQKTKMLQHQFNYQVEIKKIKEVMKQQMDNSIKNKLDFYLKLLKLSVIEKENDQYKFLHYNSK